MIVQRQVWHYYTKYLIADGYGSVQAITQTWTF